MFALDIYPFKLCQGHKQEVCGLKWSGNRVASSANLASGGNNNKVCIWDLQELKCAAPAGLLNTDQPVPEMSYVDDMGLDNIPLWKFHEHTVAAKVLAWNPHILGVLMTGGRTQDKHIQFSNTGLQPMFNEHDMGNQPNMYMGISYSEHDCFTNKLCQLSAIPDYGSQQQEHCH
ncbi:hypothetical protein GYMLUDRAFT_55737 [Collybiopsis luxurians FD-317 M1]|nr:hypothetical protein GYMLUDRAFT_55737 [Collybiopsis luxurians FD-317 M1]